MISYKDLVENLMESQDKSIQMLKKAKSLAKVGKFDDAWEVVKNDSTLDKEVTKEKWIKWIKTKV